MNTIKVQITAAKYIKKVLKIKNLTLFIRKRIQNLGKLIYKKRYNSEDIIKVLIESGVKSGYPIIVHSAYSNLYNYTGTPNELIDKLIEYIGPNGTLCMPAFPHDKNNPENFFDINNSKSAAGYLTEVFRNRTGSKRSLNQLHSVCAIGKDADFITNDHHNSRICFDEHSPFYKIAQLRGYIINIGLPKWYVGTGEHVCEALLYDRVTFFRDKFSKSIKYTYIDIHGEKTTHTMLTGAKTPYVRRKSTQIIDTHFDKSYYKRKKLSNIWITCYDMHYLIDKLTELAIQGETIYSYPKTK